MTRLVKQPEAENAVEGIEGVAQSDLLALFVSTAGVADVDLVNAPGGVAPPGDLRGDLRLEAKAVRFQPEAAQYLTPEDLVASLHVCEIEIGKHVRQCGQHTVGHRVPEVKDAVAFTT